MKAYSYILSKWYKDKELGLIPKKNQRLHYSLHGQKKLAKVLNMNDPNLPKTAIPEILGLVFDHWGERKRSFAKNAKMQLNHP